MKQIVKMNCYTPNTQTYLDISYDQTSQLGSFNSFCFWNDVKCDYEKVLNVRDIMRKPFHGRVT